MTSVFTVKVRKCPQEDSCSFKLVNVYSQNNIKKMLKAKNTVPNLFSNNASMAA